jgi:hypothetical protein
MKMNATTFDNVQSTLIGNQIGNVKILMMVHIEGARVEEECYVIDKRYELPQEHQRAVE